MVEEGKALADKPHIVISTPGRLADHINTGTNFSLKKLRFLVGKFSLFVGDVADVPETLSRVPTHLLSVENSRNFANLENSWNFMLGVEMLV